MTESREVAAFENQQVLTVNEQILEHEAAIEDKEGQIETMLNLVKGLRKAVRKHRADQDKLRKKREVFARAAFDLRQVDQP